MDSKKYVRLIEEGNIFSYSLSKGTFILPPNGFILWEQIKLYLNEKFLFLGAKNVSLPALIPMSLLKKEKSHVDGFSPELFLVKRQKMNEEFYFDDDHEDLVLRPTSEVLFYDWFSKSLHSYKQLPFIYNQWCQVFRAEKNTKPFLRNTEFLWQEGHTLQVDDLEAKKFAKQILEVYRNYVEKVLCISPIVGLKTFCEKFAGAQESYTVECLLPDFQCLQLATSHFFGKNFSTAFNVKFRDKGNLLSFPSSTSWGTSTRAMGAIALAHSDEFGLVFPFYLSPVQIGLFKYGDSEELNSYQNIVFHNLSKIYRCKIYDESSQNFANIIRADKEGCAIKIFCGFKELESDTLTISLRIFPKKKIVIKKNEIELFIKDSEEKISLHLLEKSTLVRKNHTFKADNYEVFMENFGNKNLIFLVPFCNTESCELSVKKSFPSFSFRCMSLEEISNKKCIFCLNDSVSMSYLGRSY
jgi:prolyl-tRNA synthetase